MSAKEKRIPVAVFLAQRIEDSGKSEREIAEETGYEQPNMISMFKQGLAKIPISKVASLANALGIDPAHFLRMVMRVYMPETWDALDRVIGSAILTRNELEMLTCYRRVTGDTDPPAIMLGGIVALLTPHQFRA